MAHAFKLGQRLNVPNTKGFQGVVTTPTSAADFDSAAAAAAEITTGEAMYFLRWIGADGQTACGWFRAGLLTLANQVDSDPPRLPVGRLRQREVSSAVAGVAKRSRATKRARKATRVRSKRRVG